LFVLSRRRKDSKGLENTQKSGVAKYFAVVVIAGLLFYFVCCAVEIVCPEETSGQLGKIAKP